MDCVQLALVVTDILGGKVQKEHLKRHLAPERNMSQSVLIGIGRWKRGEGKRTETRIFDNFQKEAQ